MCAKNHLLVFSSFLDIWENVEWPRFFGPPCTLTLTVTLILTLTLTHALRLGPNPISATLQFLAENHRVPVDLLDGRCIVEFRNPTMHRPSSYRYSKVETQLDNF